MKKLVLIDSNALVHRAFHALPPLSSPSGKPTNAVYGFTSVLLKMISDLKPDSIIATFDLAGPTFRHEEYEAYKAHRVKAPDELYEQIPNVKRMLAAFGIPVVEQPGLEADDIIGTISAQTQDIPGLQTIIVTGDLDTLQLVHGNKVVVFTLRKGMSDTVIYDEDAVRERYGIAPSRVPDLKGLKGDPSDNIPGVKGIGEKTAMSLVQAFGSIEQLYQELEKPEFIPGKQSGVSVSVRAKLLEHKDMALFSKKLATIVRDASIPYDADAAMWRDHTDLRAIETLCMEFGFSSLLKRISTLLNAAPNAAAPQQLDLDASPATTSEIVTVAISDIQQLPKGDAAALHVITAEQGPARMCVTTDGTTTYEIESPSSDDIAAVCTMYPTLIGHSLKPLLKHISDESKPAAHTYLDIELAAWLINPEQRDYSLPRIAYDILGRTLPDDQRSWAAIIWELRGPLAEQLNTLGLASIFTSIEAPLIPILAAMERTGVLVDTTHIDDLMATASTEIAKLEEQIYHHAGTSFNINSPSQLGDILFTKLGLQGRVRRTGGGAPSTAAAELEKLRDEHPIVDLVLQYRELNKLKTTYIEPFPTLVGADGRIHTTYNQTGTATGRLSSSEPNLQNIPTRTELGSRFRAAFIAPPDKNLLSLDYSQLELRLIAHIAQDQTMLEAFRNGEDIHTRTASEVFGLAPAQVTKDMRRQAKVLNFGIIYGMGSVGFARAAGIDRTAAKRFIEEYFARFSGIARYIERTKEEAFSRGFVTTLLGRRRPLPDIASRIPQLAAQAERMAINHPIQGTGADLVKLAMIAIGRYLASLPHAHRPLMLLQVHDELVFEVPTDGIPEAAATLARIMEQVYTLDVPLIVDAKAGPNWSDMQPIPHTAP
ncbi:MAG: DNA polymerase I [Candidatus Yanofskybacteria bacterium]|nr:DNA polymerase I [Candidatus Yanofskybacteria bacterium]